MRWGEISGGNGVNMAVLCVKCEVGMGDGTQILWDKEARPYHTGCFPWDEKPVLFKSMNKATTSEARGEYNPMLPRCNEKGEMPATKYEDEMMNQTTKVHCPACGKMVTNCEHGVSSVFTDDPYKFGTIYPDKTLSLLVIDLGENQCVIKVEHGPFDLKADDIPLFPVMVKGDSRLFYKSFAEVKAAIDAMEGDKPPIPRLERTGLDGDYEFLLTTPNQPMGDDIGSDTYANLCQLAGVKIPVYEGGKWEQLFPPSDIKYYLPEAVEDFEPMVAQFIETLGHNIPLSVWRFTK